MPDPDRVPAGSHRELLLRLHQLYEGAGLPSTRTISQRIRKSPLPETVSHETVSALLRGAPLPAWSKIRAVIIVLCGMSDQRVDVEEELSIGVELCSAAQRGTAEPVVEPALPVIPVAAPAPAPSPPAAVEVLATAVLHGPLPDRDPFFVGRETLLDRIRKRLVRDPHAPLVVFGPIGAGKSQLVREFVAEHAGEYAIIWWVDAGDVERATTSLLTLAEKLQIDFSLDRRQTLERLFAFLAGSRNYLLIFDGVRDGDIRTLIRTVGGSVIVTTRNAGWARDSTHTDVEIPDLDLSEVTQHLRKRDPHMPPWLIRRLVAVVGRMPLALAEAYHVYRHRPVASWEDLPVRLDDPAAAPLSRGGPPCRVVAEVRDALRLIEGDPAAVRLLTLLAGFGPGPVWVPMLAAGARGEVSAGLRAMLSDQVLLRSRIPVLVRVGLARLAPDESVELPALLRLAVRELMPETTAGRNRDDVREILVTADDGHPDDPHTWPMHRAIAPHVRATGLLRWRRPAAYRTAHHQIRYLFRSGDPHEARRLGEEAEAALAGDPAVARNDTLALQIRRDYANALRACGEYPAAEALTAEAMARLGSDPAYADHQLALDLARSRAHDLRIAGDYRRAFELDDQTLQRHRRAFPEGDLRLAASRYNRSVSLRILGRFTEALAADEAELIRMRNGVGDGRAPHRLLNAIAEDLYGLGRYGEIMERLQPVLAHGAGRDLLRARRMAGVAVRRMGGAGAAAEHLGACHQACVAQVGAVRELTIAVAMSFANALREGGQLPSALRFAEQAVTLYQQALGPANPLVQAARVNLAATLIAMGRGGPAEETAQDAYDALLDGPGPEHPFTVAAAANLASAIAVTDPASARGVSEAAYRTARSVYGDQHPETLLIAANFAADRGLRHEPDGDHPSLDAALGGLRRVLGARHPAVLSVAEGTRALASIEPPSA
ncbi:FxSxx-COOH system tetratricopeptide repeat protein [Actinoplanes utahensis]|nr:FxSxx-COOH system tetratricopeptide repeat protein [Actinoplanes utahensis]